MEFNVSSVERKIQYIEENLSRLETLRRLSYQEFTDDFRNIGAAVHRLQISVEAMIDICSHFVARLRLKAPADASELIRALVMGGYMPRDHGDIYIRMVKFRNRVVHLYQEVDEQEIYRILESHTGDLHTFILDARRILTSAPSGPNEAPGGRP